MEQPTKPLALVAEDNDSFSGFLKESLGMEGLTVVITTTQSATLNEYDRLVTEDNQPSVIFMDGLMPLGRPGDDDDAVLTVDFLLKGIRGKGFRGVIVGMSSDDRIADKLHESGCDQAYDKIELWDKLEDVLQPILNPGP